MDFSNILVISGCIIGLLIIGKIFSVPLKAIFKLILNSVLGGILIFIINIIGGTFGFHIGLNLATAIIVGILGIPRSNFTCNITNFSLKYISLKK